MNNFKLSKYQQDILTNIINKRDNILVNAKAGSGKTSTLIMIADKIINTLDNKCLFLAFNKSIVEELKLKITSDKCEIKTIHSLGLSFLRSYLYRKHGKNYSIEINTSKCKDIVEEYFNQFCQDDFIIANEEVSKDELKEIRYNVIRELVQLTSFCRLYNINYHIYKDIIELMYDHCNYLKDYKNLGLHSYPKVIEASIDKIKYLFEHPEPDEDNNPVYIIDYTDMIYFPCLYQMNPPYSLKDYIGFVMVDECQDLSILQQHFVQLLDFNTRYIFVGDEKQAIYGFAGADTNSINNLKRNFKLTELPLNICYRCPENIIRVAQSIVPEIEWNIAREDKGIVEFIHNKDLYKKLQPKDIIIGRRNRDLVKLYKQLVLVDKTPVKFKNIEMVNSILNDFNQSIRKYISLYNKGLNIEKKLYSEMQSQGINRNAKKYSKAENMYIEKKVKELVTANKRRKINITKSNYTLDYLLKCMQEFKEEGAYAYLEEGNPDNILKEYYDITQEFIQLFKDKHSSLLVVDFLDFLENYLKGNLNKDVPIISSIHMMKGGEADNIFILDYPKFPYINSYQSEDDQQQEVNLEYVALTRAKKNLYLCLIEDDTGDSETTAAKNKQSQLKVNGLLNHKEEKNINDMNNTLFDTI